MNTIADKTELPGAFGQTGTMQDTFALGGRLLLAALFILAGLNKLGGMEGTVGYIASVGMPFPEAVFYATVALEIGGGLLLAAGFKARQAALALGLFSIACAVVFHSNFADQMELTNFLKNLSIAGGMFAIAAFGPGRYSLDRG